MRDFALDTTTSERDELMQLFFQTYFSIRPQSHDWKSDFICFYKYRCFVNHLWLKAIQKERSHTKEMQLKFEEAIEFEGKHPFSGEIERVLQLIK